MTKRPTPPDKPPRRADERRFQPPGAQPPPLEKISVEPEERFPRVPPPQRAAPRPQPSPTPATPAAGAGWSRLANILTGLLVVLTLGTAGGFVWASQNPYHPLNPLARPTPLPVIVTATFLPATETPPATPTTEPTPRAVVDGVSASPQAAPTLGLPVAGEDAPAPTPTPLGGAAPAPAAAGAFPFALLGEVVYTENENERGCNWASIAGVVYDAAGEPLPGVGVRLTNIETDEPITVFTGSSSRFPDGFEYVVNNAPLTAAYRVAVVSSGGGALSEETVIVTSQRCNQNVLVVNFEQVATP